MSWNPKYIILILFTTAVSYFSALLIEDVKYKSFHKLILGFTVAICLGVLFFFKYFNFVSESVTTLLHAISIPANTYTVNVLLPVGISFYTFQTLSYVIDVYKGNIKAERNFGIYATFISFFPQLVAGPIERTSNLLPQIKSEKKFDYALASYGLKQMAWGWFKKLAIADVAAQYVDSAYSSLSSCTALDLVGAIFFFTIQIYCDFSGYTDIAIGTSKLLGIRLMANFNSPYLSLSLKEFWSRWHISLSTWFKDYVYIPLGGNRCPKWRRDINLFITFLASGLWHGANWTFVLWGSIHGFFQIIENRLKLFKRKTRIGCLIRWCIVFVFVNVAWVFFRSQNINDALFIFATLFSDLKTPSSFRYHHLSLNMVNMVFSLIVLFGFDFINKKKDVIQLISEQNIVLRWAIYICLIWMIWFFMIPSGTSEFVYFQF